MPSPADTPIVIAEDGTETHESWLLVRANHISSHPGSTLFDSEVAHQHLIRVTISRAKRRRDLHRDWLGKGKTLVEFDLSQAQWGAFVSSFGQGTGVPATLGFLTEQGMVPGAPFDSRLNQSHKDVRNAADKALAEVREAYDALAASFEAGAGKKEMRARMAALDNRMGNAPSNMEFAAKSLTEHVENVVTKARADVEGMVIAAGGDPALLAGEGPLALPAAPDA